MKKNIPSILEGCIDDLDIDALLEDTKNDISPDDAASIPKPDGQRIYSHGYTVRIDLKVSDPKARVAIIGWTEDSRDWIRCRTRYGDRWTLRGSTFLTQRSPRLKKRGSSAIARLNKQLRTKLYTIEFDRPHAGHSFFVLRGVRHTDLERLLELHMGLRRDDYEIAYYLDLERFIVIAPHVAMRLADELEGQPESGRGRLARKRWLVKNYEIPIRIRSRTKRKAKLTIYRIDGGATAQYKVEISLKGRRQNKSHFAKEDIAALDTILYKLIEDHDLQPLSKPERWEPRRAPQWHRDGRLAKLPAKAYRGTKVSQEQLRTAANGHTPRLQFWTNSGASSVTSINPPYIRKVGQMEIRPRPAAAWGRVAADIAQHDGYMSEVVLSVDQDARPLVEAIAAAGAEGSTAVGVVGAQLGAEFTPWKGGEDLLVRYPSTEDTKTLVVLVDASVWIAVADLVEGVSDAVLDAVIEEAVAELEGRPMPPLSRNAAPDEVPRSRTQPGPFLAPYWQSDWCTAPLYTKAAAALLSPLLHDLRHHCEATGQKVVLVTMDVRPDHGRGPLLKSHCFRDTRVRSHIGDAGRYYAHLRYLVESAEDGWPTWAALTKDEGQGLPGRMLWGMAAEA